MAKDQGKTHESSSEVRRAHMVAKEAANGPKQAAVFDYRRGNLRALIDIEGAGPLAQKLGMTAPRLSQVAGKNPSDSINEKQARAWELALNMEPMSFDRPLFGRMSRPTKARVVQPVAIPARRASDMVAPVQVDAQPHPANESLDHLLMETVREVADLLDAGHILLDNEKMVRVLGLAKSDAVSHGGKPNITLVGNLLKVLK